MTNTYVWDSEPAARAFFSSPEVKAKIVEIYVRAALGLPKCRP